ncbi:neuronal acetylcholine receptor subunit alpha-3-like [Acanthaster planci]|uniref:Neuronal acetylcholine receptor subunit alpha-3-like n=1 Tax=Acanthaster planci TaxID=133434 RepID=A0A8B7YY41_ACAPL|nr:neuronal acetylcholine receptor subunit alpha-3-like [Acanthaster planci]
MAGRATVRALSALVVLMTLIAVEWIIGCEGSNSAQQLFEDKMRGYDPLIRPVDNNSDVVNVSISLALSQLIDIDEKNQVMITSLWLKQQWKDSKLDWDPADYDGLEQLQVPIERLWSPDILLYNTANGDFAAGLGNWATVKYDGTVYWNPPVIFRSSCLIDISYFPFDEQRCKMKFGTWTYDGSVVDLNPLTQRVERENYRANGEWDIVESPVAKHAIKYPCCEEIFIDVTYTFVLHRNPLFYIITLVLPCILIALLTVLVFYLPSAAQEKVTLSISVLIALIVFLLLIPSIVPPTSTTVPLIARYMLFTMAIVSISIFATVWTINLHFRNSNTHTMGKWTKKVFLNVLPRLLLIERPGASHARKERARQKQMERALIRSNVTSSFVYSPVDAAAAGGRGRKEPGGYSKMVMSGSTLSPSLREEIEYRERSGTLRRYEEYEPVKREWDDLLENLQYIQENLKHADEVEDSEEDWKYVGLVVDRLLLWIFLIVVVVGTAVFFVQAPILWESPDEHKREVYDDPEVLLTAGYYDLFPTDPPIPQAVSQAI